MSDEEKVEPQVEVTEPQEQAPQVEEPQKPESPQKITSKEKKPQKEKDPKKVAQGNRLAKVSQKAKEKKMREQIENESRINFSINYHTLLYLAVPLLVFAGFYLYLSRKNASTENIIKFSPVKKTPTKKPEDGKLNLSRYSIRYEKLLERVKTAHREFEAQKRDTQEFYRLHFCENSPENIHKYELYKPHPGCVKQVCQFCAQEHPEKLFSPSVYAYKGRRFEFKPKHRFETIKTYST